MATDVKEYKIQKYIARLDELADENQGELSAEIVLDDAKKPSSALHDWFEWNNTKAAQEYRLEQARALIRKCYIIITDDADPDRTFRVRGFQHAGGAYRRVDDIAQNESWSTELMQRLAKEIATLRQRYSQISSLRAVYAKVDPELERAEVAAKNAA